MEMWMGEEEKKKEERGSELCGDREGEEHYFINEILYKLLPRHTSDENVLI